MTELVRDDFFVDPDIARAESLPSTAFTRNAFLEEELRTVFQGSWLLLPEADHVENGDPKFTGVPDRPGARVPLSVLGKPLFLQRDLDKRLLCFPNVCTHAWHPLVDKATSGGSIICPQHGRKFGLNGKFLSHQGFEHLKDFPRESDHLKALSVQRESPFVFVCLGQPFATLEDFLGKMKESIPGIDFRNLERKHAGNDTRLVDGNWKQHAWNYMDNYHIRFVHKGPQGLSGAIDLSSYHTELYDYSSLQWAYARNPDHGFDPKLLASRFQDPRNPTKRVFALWWFIFPNLTLNFYPWGLSVNQYMPVPGNPHKTLFHWYKYALDAEKFQKRDKFWLGDQVDMEDIEAISLVNKGVESELAPRGRFAPKEETGPHWFHRLIYKAMFETNRIPRP